MSFASNPLSHDILQFIDTPFFLFLISDSSRLFVIFDPQKSSLEFGYSSLRHLSSGNVAIKLPNFLLPSTTICGLSPSQLPSKRSIPMLSIISYYSAVPQ